MRTLEEFEQGSNGRRGHLPLVLAMALARGCQRADAVRDADYYASF